MLIQRVYRKNKLYKIILRLFIKPFFYPVTGYTNMTCSYTRKFVILHFILPASVHLSATNCIKKSTIFWDAMLCIPVEFHLYFRETYFFRLQD
jgi:hypothetical protein